MRAVLLILGLLLSFYSIGQNENNLIRYYNDGNYKLYVDYYEKYFDNEYFIDVEDEIVAYYIVSNLLMVCILNQNTSHQWSSTRKRNQH